MMKNKNIIRVAVVIALILLVPFVAMPFTDEVVWTLSDFSIAGFLLFGFGLVYVLTTRNVGNAKLRVTIGVVIGALLLIIWAELAVGILGTPWAGS